MYNGKNVSFRFGMAAALLAVWVIGVTGLAVVGLMHPKSDVTKTDVTQAVDAVAGDQNLYAICEASITQSVTSAGGTVQSLKHVKVKESKNGAKVTVALASDVYVGSLTCDLTKSNWSVAQVAP